MMATSQHFIVIYGDQPRTSQPQNVWDEVQALISSGAQFTVFEAECVLDLSFDFYSTHARTEDEDESHK